MGVSPNPYHIIFKTILSIKTPFRFDEQDFVLVGYITVFFLYSNLSNTENFPSFDAKSTTGGSFCAGLGGGAGKRSSISVMSVWRLPIACRVRFGTSPPTCCTPDTEGITFSPVPAEAPEGWRLGLFSSQF